MTTVALNYLTVQKKNLPVINWKIICLIGFLIFFVLSIFYVLQIIALTKSSYLISAYERQISKLSEENKNLEVSFAESNFLGEVLIKIQELNFQKTTSVKYIKIPDNSVAIKK